MGGRLWKVVAHEGWTVFLVQENFHTVVKLSAKVRFRFHRGQTRELFTGYCQYPATSLDVLKIYVLNIKNQSCRKNETIIFTCAFISIPYLC